MQSIDLSNTIDSKEFYKFLLNFKVKNASNRPFLLHYGVKAPKASYISLKGPMRIHSNKYIEVVNITILFISYFTI